MTQIKLRYVHVFRDRHGKVRRYFRRAGFRQVPLPGLPGSCEFMEAYQAALSGSQPNEKIGVKIRPGTMRALIRNYLQSASFTNLSPEFQRVRRNILERFAEEHGEKQVGLLGSHHVQSMVWAKKSTPFAARNFHHTIRVILSFAVERGLIKSNPAVGVKSSKQQVMDTKPGRSTTLQLSRLVTPLDHVQGLRWLFCFTQGNGGQMWFGWDGSTFRKEPLKSGSKKREGCSGFPFMRNCTVSSDKHPLST